MSKAPQLADYLDSKSTPEPNSGCTLWTGALNQDGYGKAQHKRRTWVAHRLSWLNTHGDDPGEMFVCHKCDTRSCINPDHLFLGTPADNSADMVNKGRSGRAKLSDDQVQAIRGSDGPHAAIARRHGVSSGLVSMIKRGLRWGPR